MEKPRVLPASHKYAVCASDDMPIKSYYQGIFDEVFIFFHPFIRPKSIDYKLFEPETYPGKNEIIEKCELVTWREFLGISGIESYHKLDVGLRTRILGLKKQYSDESIARLTQDACEKNKLIAPTEGFFPEFLINKILMCIIQQGDDWIWCGDEFCSERKLEYIEDIINDNEALRNQRLNLFTHDNSLLLTTHWDSHFSMLCSNKETVDQIVQFCNLEGFYCDDETEIFWSLTKSLCGGDRCF